MSKEIWRPVTGFEDTYAISSNGRCMNIRSGKVLVGSCTGGKYSYILIGLSKNGCRYFRLLHRIVAEHFLGRHLGNKPLVLHRNGDRLDNRASNLYWGDDADNAADAIRHGTHVQPHNNGSKNGQSKLTETMVETIRHLAEIGEAQSTIATSFHISQSCVSRIINRKRWGLISAA